MIDIAGYIAIVAVPAILIGLSMIGNAEDRRDRDRWERKMLLNASVDHIADCTAEDGKIDYVKLTSLGKPPAVYSPSNPPAGLANCRIDYQGSRLNQEQASFSKMLAQAEEALKVVGTGKLRDGAIVFEGCRAYSISPAPMPTSLPPPGRPRR